MNVKLKIFNHLISIMLFLCGSVILHTITNNLQYSKQCMFFNIVIPWVVPFDTAFVCLGISFCIEFIMTFKPLKIIMEENK